MARGLRRRARSDLCGRKRTCAGWRSSSTRSRARRRKSADRLRAERNRNEALGVRGGVAACSNAVRQGAQAATAFGGRSRRARQCRSTCWDRNPARRSSTSAADAETRRCKSARVLTDQGALFCIERDARKSRDSSAGALRRPASPRPSSPATRAPRFCRPISASTVCCVDAPCSGTGVVGRHPEARWKKQGTDGERLALTQRALLEQSGRHVHPGGALVYAVCSTDPRETTEVIDWFLARQNFERGLIPSAYARLLDAKTATYSYRRASRAATAFTSRAVERRA